MHRRLFAPLVGLLLLASGAHAQQRMNDHTIGQRALLIVPMVGAGTYEDPRRPLTMPRQGAALPEGVLGMRFEESDDGKSAIVEVIARDRQSLNAVLSPSAGRGDVRRFDKGSARKEDIEQELRARKKDFDLERFVNPGNERKPGVAATPGAGAR